MTGPVQIEYFGLVEAFVSMEAWCVDLGPALETAAESFGDMVATETAAIVPVLTGTLAASVQSGPTPDGVEISIGGPGTGAEDYAGWIEFGGTRGRPWIPGGRYLYPTVRANEGQWAALLIETANETARTFPWPIPVLP